jgi:hypothetical protein
MKRYSYRLIGLILVLVVSGGFTGCSIEDPADQNGDIHLKMAEIENAVFLKHFKTTPVSLEIANLTYFSKASELKFTTQDFERNKIKAELCSYDLSTSKFSGQQKNNSAKLTDKERILYESFLNSFNNSEVNSVAICEFYINEVSCLKIDDQVKSDFINRITFFKDLLIFIDYEGNKEEVSGDVVKKVLAIPFDDCFDNCMSDEIREATSSTVRTVFFLLHLPFRAAEFLVICTADCI